MKIGFYHHGSAPAPDVAAAIAEKRVSYAGRNALAYSGEVEKAFTEVVLDEGKHSEAIRKAYEDAGIPVRTVEEFLNAEPKAEAPAKSELKPDEPRAKPKGKTQGEPKAEAPAKSEAPAT